MRKFILVVTSVLFLGFGFANAQSIGNSSIPNTVLSNADKDVLFGGSANVMLLSSEEMKSTQGFGFWSNIGNWFSSQKDWLIPVASVGAVAGCAAFAPACALGFAF